MESKDELADYRDPDWVAEKLGLEKNTVYKFLQDGVIPAMQLGRKWLISERRLMAWLAAETDAQTHARRDAAVTVSRTVRRMENFSPHAREVIKQAHTQARGLCHNYLGQEHLLLAFAARPECSAAGLLASLGVDMAELDRRIKARLQTGEGVPARRLGRTPEAKKAMHLAQRESRRLGKPLVDTADMLWGILQTDAIGKGVLADVGVTPEALERARTKANRWGSPDSPELL